MPENLGRILATYRELPSTSPFCKTTEQYATDQYIRVVHESNALEDEGPKRESQTKKLGDDLAYHLLNYHRHRMMNYMDGVRMCKASFAAIEELTEEQRHDRAIEFFQKTMEKEMEDITTYLHQHGVDLNDKPKNPVVTNHIAAFCNLIYTTRILAIFSREIIAESAMTDHEFDYESIDVIVVNLIRFFHYTLMKDLHENVGNWKTEKNNMGHEGPTTYAPEAVPEAMINWIRTLRKLLKKVIENEHNIFDVAAWATHSFLVIHPFSDGNGRMSRIILNSLLIAFGEVPFPIVITDGTSSGKTKYIKALRKVDRKEESLFYFTNLTHLKPYSKLIMDGVLKSFKQIDSRTKDQVGEEYKTIL